MPRAFMVYDFIQYTGENKQEVIDAITAGTSEVLTTVSEAPNGYWRFGNEQRATAAMPTDYVMYLNGAGINSVSNSPAGEFARFWRVVDE